MNLKKIFIEALCLCIILFGISYLLNQYTEPNTNNKLLIVNTPVGGAAKYQDKLDIKNSPYFAQPDIYNMQSNEHLTILPHYPTIQQSYYYSCAPAAANTVVKYYNQGNLFHTEAEVCQYMSTNKSTGTNTKGIADYFNMLGWEVRSSEHHTTPSTYNEFLQFVQSHLKNNTPIIVENIDWGGHWRVIIGYDTMATKQTRDDVLIMADPYDTSDHLQDGYNIVPAERFFYMWFDYQLFPKDKQKRQWVTAKPKQQN